MNKRRSKQIKLAIIYRKAFKIMINAFKTDNIYDAINSSIMEVKAYTNSDAIILYRIDNNSNMKYFISNDYDVTTVTKIIDNNKSILKNNNYRIITPNLNNIKNISFFTNSTFKYSKVYFM